MPTDLTLLYTRPTTRHTSATNRVDLFLPPIHPHIESIVVANYVKAEHANAIIDAIQDYNNLLDLLRDLVGDLACSPQTKELPLASLTAARTYLSTHP